MLTEMTETEDSESKAPESHKTLKDELIGDQIFEPQDPK